MVRCTAPVLCEGGGARGELPESDRTEIPRPRERFTDTVAEPQGPKDWNHPEPSEGNAEEEEDEKREEVRGTVRNDNSLM